MLRFIAEGYRNQEIADKLRLSKRTVDSHWQSLREKYSRLDSLRHWQINHILGASGVDKPVSG